jgi:H+/gluconate symporter-like permease
MRKLGLALVVVVAASSALAQASGNGALSGTARIKVKPECGKNRQAVNANWVLNGAACAGTGTFKAIERGSWTHTAKAP